MVSMLSVASAARADAAISIDLKTGASVPAVLRVALDADDDDENGTRDADEQTKVAGDELVALRITGAKPGMQVRAEGGLRLLLAGTPVAHAPANATLQLQGVRVSKSEGDAALVFEQGEQAHRFPVTVVGLSWLDASNAILDASNTALGISRHITHDGSLPREIGENTRSEDPENVRIEVEDASAQARVLYVNLVARDVHGLVTDVLRHLPLSRVGNSHRFRSGFVRLVADNTDKSAPEIGGQLLKVRLRDRVGIRLGDARAPLTQDAFVGKSGNAGGDRSVLRGKLRVTVLRMAPDGATVLGEDVEQAEQLSREQVVIANEIWAQCFIDFGRPEETEVRIVAPPPPALLSIADIDGLPAAGDGKIRVRAGERSIGPVPTIRGNTPEQTAQSLARAFRSAGFSAEVSLNPRTERGAYGSADLIVRDRRGALVALSVDSQGPLTTDSRQRMEVGHVDLRDGIQEFDNDVSAAGTLEERTLMKLLSDDDPTSIDVILINHFVNPDRQGEAFIESDVSNMANTLIFDRNAVRYQRQAWVQAHELGHVLMDEPFHPDNLGPDRSYLLMDSDARQGRVTGPKRLSDVECKRARRRSGPGAQPVVLVPAP